MGSVCTYTFLETRPHSKMLYFKKGVLLRMKKNLTKLLALMMALALVFSLAACGGNTGDESSTDPSNNPAANESVDNDDTVPPAENTDPNATNEDPSATDENPSVTDESQKPDDTKPGDTQKPGDTKKPDDNKPDANGIAVPKNANEAMALYNSALAKTSVTGKMTSVTLDSATATIVGDLKKLDPKVDTVFKDYTKKNFNNKLFNLSGASLKGTPKEQGGKIVMTFTLKDVSEHNPAYGKNGFMYFVTRDNAVGTVDAIVKAIGGAAESLNIQLDKNSANIVLNNGTLEVQIDKNTGKLTSATYSFKETVTAKAKAKVGPLPASLNATIIGSGTCTYTGK